MKKNTKQTILGIAIVLTIPIAGALIYGLAVEPYWLEIRTTDAPISDLPADAIDF